MDTMNPQPYFAHPANAQLKVFVFLDPAHNIKLVRNVFECTEMKSDSGYISWEFVNKLHNAQIEANLRAGNKLSSEHLNFKRQKMKVKLAAQTISKSTADALQLAKETSGYF